MIIAPDLPFPPTLVAPRVEPSAPHPRRFTLDGSARLEEHLQRVQGEVRQAVLRTLPPGKVEAILLGGGYGRGEGGVLRTPTGDRPYNDLEYYVALRGLRRFNEFRHGPALGELAHHLSLLAGIEVEFKIVSLGELRAAPVTMFSYDLVVGHRWVYGDNRLLAGCEHHRRPGRIPLAEVARLLFNRCSGLLFARERLERARFTDDDADFVGRNLAKARLALGDAMLAAAGRYHWSCRERHQRLRELLLADDHPEWLRTVLHLHAAGVEFKLHPQRRAASRATLRAEHAELSRQALDVWLWLESRRLERPFVSAAEYALAREPKYPGRSRWWCAALNWRTFGLRGLVRPGATRHPRERLGHALTLLLWEPAALTDSRLLRILQRQLQTSDRTLTQLVATYEKLWGQHR
jgi:hypothetical protein